MKSLVAVLALIVAANVPAVADTYLQNPRGTNGKINGALIRSVTSTAFSPEELRTGRLAPGHHKWSAIHFVMFGGGSATGPEPLEYVESALKSKKGVDLDFSQVQVYREGGRQVMVRTHFDGAVIQSADSVTVDGLPAVQVTFVFQKITCTDVKTGAVTQDTWAG